MPAKKMFISAKSVYRLLLVVTGCFLLLSYIKKEYSNPDFGNTFGTKAEMAKQKLQSLNEGFVLCSKLCNSNPAFMQSIVFPEVMRYNILKDGIEAESLRTLYVQLGADYANFSIGLFQMKPSFAVLVEEKSKQLLADSIYKELELSYTQLNEESIRQQRVERLQDTDWQLVYLTAFICICNEIYKHKTFATEKEKLQWYATVYNAGFNKADADITRKIEQENFYLEEGMPGKKFKYSAIAGWYFSKQ